MLSLGYGLFTSLFKAATCWKKITAVFQRSIVACHRAFDEGHRPFHWWGLNDWVYWGHYICSGFCAQKNCRRRYGISDKLPLHCVLAKHGAGQTTETKTATVIVLYPLRSTGHVLQTCQTGKRRTLRRLKTAVSFYTFSTSHKHHSLISMSTRFTTASAMGTISSVMNSTSWLVSGKSSPSARGQRFELLIS